ncbi:MAG: SCP2 sterol-binding domain-containing protein [Actinomycetota bacterium]
MATPAEVDRTLQDLVRRLDEAAIEEAGLPRQRRLLVRIKDLGLTYTATFGGGRISGLEQKESGGDEDVTITVGSDDLVALASGRMGVGGALLSGKLRVDAGFSDLLLIRQLF